MKTIVIAAAALALGLVPAAPVSAEDRDPSCTYEVKPRFRLAPVLKNGIPVRVTCAGPAETSSILTFASRRQDDDWVDLHNHGVPGIAKSDILRFTEAGTRTLRVEIVPKRFFRRYAKTKVRVLLGEKLDPERLYHTSVDGGKVVTLVR
jgi:hypothetical protein